MKNKKTKKRIVVIGGGTGSFMVLSALRDYPVELTSIVSMADSGGSTGRLRDQYGVLPPGDVRRALVALSGASDTLRELFNYRYETGDLRGHSFGNIFLSTLEKVTGDFGNAVKEAARVLNVDGEVMPVTLRSTTLHARLTDGSVIHGETNIDRPIYKTRAHIEKLWFGHPTKINPEARQAIMSADMIVIGPGDLYTSLIPNLLVHGVVSAIKRSKAKKVYVCNLMTKFGETHGFKAQDFVDTLEKYLGKSVLDYAIFNSKRPSPKILTHYLRKNSHFVDIGGLNLKNSKPRYILADLLDSGRFIRHNPRKKLAKVLLSRF